MAKNNDKKQFTKNGQEYVLQHPGVEWTIDHTDNCTNAQGNLVRKQYIQGLFDNIVIKPKGLKISDFERVSEMREVVDEIESFL